MNPNTSHIDGLAQVDRLRQWRVRSPQLELAEAFRKARLGFEAASKADTSLQQAWARLAPGSLGTRASADRVSRGVVVVKVASGADQHAAARWLRSGGALELSREAGVAIRRWRFEYR